MNRCRRELTAILLWGLLASLLTTPANGQQDEPQFVRPDKTRGWPIYYRESYPDGRSETHALFSLYYRSLRTDGASLFLTPFYYTNREHSSKRAWSVLMPLYFSRTSDDHWDLWSLPLRRGERSSDRSSWLWAPGVLPLYSSARSETFSSADVRLGVPGLFDLFHATRFSKRTTVAAGSLLPGWPSSDSLALFRHDRNSTSGVIRSHLFPLYAYRAERYFSLPWLGWLRTIDQDSRRDWVLPMLGVVRRDPQGYDWNAALGLFAGGSRGERSWLRLEPLLRTSRGPAGAGSIDIAHIYGRSWDTEAGVSVHRVLEPLGQFESSPVGYRRRFIPIYFAGRDGEASYFAIAPFYFRADSPARSSQLLFPLYFAHTSPDASTRVAFPFYWDFATETTRTITAFPFYYQSTSPDSRLDLVLGPLYIRYARPVAGSVHHSVLWPLASYARSDDRRHSHILPLYWSDQNGADRLDIVGPIYLRASGADYSHHFLIPLYGSMRRQIDDEGSLLQRDFYAAGLWVNSRTFGPDRQRQSTRTHVLGPLAGYSRDDVSGQTHSRLLPFWWRDRGPDRRLTIATPLYVNHACRGTAGDHRLTLLGGNLWVDTRRGEAVNRGVLWPLTWYHQDPHQTWLQAIGVYHHRTTDAGRFQLRLTPLLNLDLGTSSPTPPPYRWLHLYATERGEWGHRTWFLPALADFDRRPDSQRWSVLAGLAGGASGADVSHFRVFPIYWRTRLGPPESPTRRFTALFPFYTDSLDDGGRTRSILFPLFVRDTRVDGETYQAHPWPFLSIRSGPQQLYVNAFWFMGLGRSPASSGWWFWPVASRTRTDREVAGPWSTDGYLTLALLRRSSGPASATTVLQPFLFGVHHDDERNAREWDALLSTVRYRREGEFTRFHALGLLWGSSAPDRSWWSLFPLAYSRTTQTHALARYTLPQAFHLYSRLQDTESTRWSFLWFLARSEHSHASDDHDFRLLHRLVLHRQRGTFKERVFEPFHTWEEDSSTGYLYHSVLKFLYVASRKDFASPIERRVLGFLRF
ncbi:MAG: hypothetical protein AB7O52_01385 [Planctomycetota bacterium]